MERKETESFLMAFSFAAACVLIALLVSFALSGCTMEEWRDIAADATTTAPGAVVDIVTDTDAEGNVSFEKPTDADYANGAIGFLTGLVAGWYGRKFKDKKYKKKRVVARSEGGGVSPPEA